ncbi:fimbrial protein [Klebsiella oxytoca]|nr:fimbrial protein [Klebsiella oxytoca]ELK5562721.1 fimbrial protein [Klebsiella oxytoca]ELK5572038.1 fimbrial protein [Klebsiella oxytoca]ELM1663622.1 fimbrial protein [Klebsiella oxytoca]MCY3429094.1 fimbrial protein [Klebsiella oxytoca]
MAQGNNMMQLTRYAPLLLAGVMLTVTSTLQAADPENLEFIGTLVTPPACSISEDGPVYVNFDDVRIKKVAEGRYRETVPLALKCEDNNLAWQLRLSVRGNAAGFDADNATVVTAEQANLGVKIYQNDRPFKLDEPINVNSTTLPRIDAVLVQRDGVELTEGTFSAAATLRAEYQ